MKSELRTLKDPFSPGVLDSPLGEGLSSLESLLELSYELELSCFFEKALWSPGLNLFMPKFIAAAGTILRGEGIIGLIILLQCPPDT